jgi:hypothetical protein
LTERTEDGGVETLLVQTKSTLQFLGISTCKKATLLRELPVVILLIISGLLLCPLIITERVWALESPAAE